MQRRGRAPRWLRLVAIAVVAFVFARALSNWLQPPQNERDYLLGLPRVWGDLAEKQQAPEIKRYISRDYEDAAGHDYQALDVLIMGQVLAGGQITIYTLSPDVTLDVATKPPHATLTFKATMARGAREPGVLDFVPESASLYDFRLELDKTPDGWLVESGEWARSLGR